MEIKLTKAVQAQPLDDEGDPKGEMVTLPAGGTYRLMGETWIKDADDNLYEVADLTLSLY
jgi:hypothetical protein